MLRFQREPSQAACHPCRPLLQGGSAAVLCLRRQPCCPGCLQSPVAEGPRCKAASATCNSMERDSVSCKFLLEEEKIIFIHIFSLEKFMQVQLAASFHHFCVCCSNIRWALVLLTLINQDREHHSHTLLPSHPDFLNVSFANY